MAPDLKGGLMHNKLGLTGRCGFALLGISVVALPIAYLSKAIDFGTFSAVAVLWLLVSAALIFGDSITEITLWKASIKRDVKATKEARDEAEKIRDELRDLARMVAEQSYLLASVGAYAMGAEQQARERLEKNMNDLSEFYASDPDKQKAWWKDLTSVFAHRESGQ
ncbi:hypothetical protein [Pseudomonas lactis]|uniref:hypothetical protein n=1 Tax=Pseudomonas lactis TaxID=1615674 RepID=UPI0006489621|nr:hypothetical protein [Pseudomonas lactis]